MWKARSGPQQSLAHNVVASSARNTSWPSIVRSVYLLLKSEFRRTAIEYNKTYWICAILGNAYYSLDLRVSNNNNRVKKKPRRKVT